MSQYVLDPKGNIIKVKNDIGNYVDVDIDKADAFSNAQNSFASSVKQNEAYGINIDADNAFLNAGAENLKNANSFTRVRQDANKNFDFVNDNRDKFTSYFRDFNNYGDNNNVFASEFEILGGTRSGNSNDYSTFFLDYFAEFASYFLILEAIVIANGLIQDTNSVEEKYHLKIGDYNIVEYDVYSRYVFDVLNYPKESKDLFVTLSERITCFFLGFNEFLNPDRFIDYDKIINDTTRFKNLMDTITGDIKTDENPGQILNTIGVQPLVAGLTLLLETFLVLTRSSENRLLLLIRKFANEQVWERNNLFSAKEDNDSDSGFSFLREMDYYRVRFGIERIHVGRKILRYHWYNATHLPHRLREAPQNRLGISKSKYKADIVIQDEKLRYDWSNVYSGNDYDSDEDFSQGTRLRALPQLFNLNAEYVANIVLNKLPSSGTLPEDAKEMLPIGKDLLQNFYYNNGKRIPDDLVKKIENHLESEYMPFYFRDLRTNEIISFHAFLDNISDTFSTDYSEMTGFGRIDSVKAYTKTTRSISLGFTLASTSQSDHDLMWYQINKLITMCYPQWSDGVDNTYKLGDKSIEGKFPFSQVITASPLIRLRVGDVIKSNYSKSNLSRLHGAPFKDVKDMIKNTESKDVIGEVSEGASEKVEGPPEPKGVSFLDAFNTKAEFLYVLPGMYRTINRFGLLGSSYIHIKNHTRVKKAFSLGDIGLGIGSLAKNDSFEIIDTNSKFEGQTITADKRSIISKSPLGDSNSKTPLLPIPIPGFGDDEATAADNPNVKNLQELMKPGTNEEINNPIVKAFESGMGRGLAGFITQLDLQYGDSTWETGRIGSKAPIFLKINVIFAPIHDIAPGLDHNGMMRAPTHNVGRINNEMFGDPYDNEYLGQGRHEAEETLKEYEKKASE